MQILSSALHSIGTGESDILSSILPSNFVAFSLHEENKILTAAAFLHGIGDIVHQTELPALTFLRSPPFTGRHLLAAALVFGQD